MEIVYEKALKHLGKITKSSSKYDTMTVVNGVHYAGNKVEATDRHRLLQIQSNEAEHEEKTLNVQTGEVINGQYPDLDRLLISDPDKSIIVLYEQVLGMKKILTCIKGLGYQFVAIKKQNHAYYIEPQTKNKEPNYKEDENITLQYKIGTTNEDGTDKRVIDIKYLAEAIDFIKETKTYTNLEIINNVLAPIQFSQSESKHRYHYLICPIRQY